MPEAQLDRFAIKLRIGYPDRQAQREILGRATDFTTDEGDDSHVLSLERLRQLQKRVQANHVHDRVTDYLIDLVEATRADTSIELGVSPRGMLTWQAMAQAWALLQGRDFVTPSDVAKVSRPVLSVRLLTRGEEVDSVIDRILSSVPAPEYK